jgi:hypothetical protein
MATAEQLNELVNALQTLQTRVTASESAAEESRRRQEAAELSLRQVQQRPASSPLVDTRNFGRVSNFSGARSEWSDWKFQFCAFMAGANPAASEMLAWAESQKSPIDIGMVNSKGPEVKAMSVQLYLALSLQVRNEALTKVRIGRFLVGSGRLRQLFRWQELPKVLTFYTDADHAGCTYSRRSTSGGAILHGENTLCFWSGTQTAVTTSSGESEYYAAVRAGSEALGARTVCEDAGFRLEAVGHMDSTAARAMAMRRGLGKAKHIAVQYLWLQGRIHSGDLVLMKESTEKNLGDLFTKPLTRPRVFYLLRGLGCEYATGRAEGAPKLEVDTAAMSRASPMLALTVLAMQAGRVSGARVEDDNDASDWTFWAFVAALLAIGMTTALMLRPLLIEVGECVKRARKQPAVTRDEGMQTMQEEPVVMPPALVMPPAPVSAPYAGAAVRGPDRIFVTAAGACYHAEGCSTLRDPVVAGSLRRGIRVVRRCGICG